MDRVNEDELVWAQKYRPQKVEDVILPSHLKKTFQTFVNNREVPNLLLTGKPGVGKTTVAMAMLEEMGCDYIIINGSLFGNIDTLRTTIMDFASTVSLAGGRKYVILDEADYLNINSTQPALRNFIEEFSSNCGFILTCNLKHRIMEAIWSRCSVVEFTIDTKDKPKLAMEFLNRLTSILDNQKVEYDKKVLAQLITVHFPDWRRIINECQRYSATGKIDSGILKNFSDDNMKELIGHLKSKSFSEIRKWVSTVSDMDPLVIMRSLYEASFNRMDAQSAAALVLILAEYQFKASFVADQELNLVACLTQVMVDCSWN